MSELSPALQRICTAAIAHFAENGYDGASLSTIAQTVGIRKASLYSHVEGKDALFLLCLVEAVEVECAFVRTTFAQPLEAQGPGAGYATALADRFDHSVHLRFLLRAAYFPPAVHREAVAERFNTWIEMLSGCYQEQLRSVFAGRFSAEQEARYIDAYLGIIDSLCVDLLYVGAAQMQRRLLALWQILSDSLALRSHGM